MAEKMVAMMVLLKVALMVDWKESLMAYESVVWKVERTADVMELQTAAMMEKYWAGKWELWMVEKKVEHVADWSVDLLAETTGF